MKPPRQTPWGCLMPVQSGCHSRTRTLQAAGDTAEPERRGRSVKFHEESSKREKRTARHPSLSARRTLLALLALPALLVLLPWMSGQ